MFLSFSVLCPPALYILPRLPTALTSSFPSLGKYLKTEARDKLCRDKCRWPWGTVRGVGRNGEQATISFKPHVLSFPFTAFSGHGCCCRAVLKLLPVEQQWRKMKQARLFPKVLDHHPLESLPLLTSYFHILMS